MKKSLLLFFIMAWITGCYSTVVRDKDPSYTYFKLLQTHNQDNIRLFLNDLSSSDKEDVINETNNPYGLGVIAVTVYMEMPTLIDNLVQMGADIDQIGSKGLTALHIAANIGDLETLKTLLDTYHAKPSLTISQENLLHIATQTPQNPVVKELIARYPEMIHQQDQQGNTPLHYAVQNNDITTVRLLKKAKAKVNVNNKEKLTPLEYSINMNYDTITGILRAKK